MKNTSDRIGTRTIWIGRWTVAVAVLHTAFAVIVMRDPLIEVARRGYFDAIGRDAEIAAPVWFILFGFLLFILGLAITALERSLPEGRVPIELGWGLLLLCAIGLVLMPASGFYLALVPAIAIIARARQHFLRVTPP